jgi:hypothetical protein
MIVCFKEEQCTVMNFCGLKAYQEQKSISDFQQSMGTVLYCSRICMTWLTNSKGSRPTGVTFHIQYRVSAIILNNRRVTVDEVASHVHISHGSKHEIIRKDQAFVKTVQDGSQAGHRRAQLIALISASTLWIAVKEKVMSFWDTSSVCMKHGSTVTYQKRV